MLDDEEPSRAGTPKPLGEKDEKENKTTGDANEPKRSSTDSQDVRDGVADKKDDAADGATGEQKKAESFPPVKALTPEIKQKLRKLEKLEATYPGKARCWIVILDEADIRCLRTPTILPSCPSTGHSHRALRESPTREYALDFY